MPHGNRYEIHGIQPQLCKDYTSALNGLLINAERVIKGNEIRLEASIR